MLHLPCPLSTRLNSNHRLMGKGGGETTVLLEVHDNPVRFLFAFLTCRSVSCPAATDHDSTFIRGRGGVSYKYTPLSMQVITDAIPPYFRFPWKLPLSFKASYRHHERQPQAVCYPRTIRAGLVRKGQLHLCEHCPDWLW